MITVHDVSKKYFLDRGKRSLKDVLTSKDSKSSNEFWALKNVSFSVNKGEILGIVGQNGSGKSTLLKIISRITLPTSGFVEVRGKIQSLLEIGAGFHPDLTGKDNIYLSCAIYGLSAKDTKKLEQKIIEFSEISDFIDTPIKFYSSGMAMRLAFSVSVHVNADIILLDEVWTVGDIEFQEKSFAKIKTLMSSGTTVLLVSHDPIVIDKFCTRIIKLDHGHMVDSKCNFFKKTS